MYGKNNETAAILRPGVYGRRSFADSRGCRDLLQDQSERAGFHGLRAAGLEESWRWTQGPGVPGPAGAVGEPGNSYASSQEKNRFQSTRKEHQTGWRGDGQERTYGQCRSVYPRRDRAGGKTGAATAVQRSGQPISLPGIRHALRGQAAIFVLRESSQSGSGWLPAVFEPGLADESSGSVDWMGRCYPWAKAAACGQQQPISGLGEYPQSGQHAAGRCSEAAEQGVAEILWDRTVPGGDPGRSKAVLRRVLPCRQFYCSWENQWSRPNGPYQSTPWRSRKDRSGLPFGQRCAPSAQRISGRVRSDECIGCLVLPGAVL